MFYIEKDTLDKNSPIILLFIIMSMIGMYDIIQEIMQDHEDIFKKNIVKKALVFSGLYLKTESIFTSSIVSIILFLSFPKVFFGEPTTKK